MLFKIIFLAYAVIFTNCETNYLCTENKTDIVFLVDSSTSILENVENNSTAEKQLENWKLIISFLLNVTSRLSIDKSDRVRVGLITFATDVNKTMNLTSDYEKIVDNIVNLKYLGGNTNTEKALETARNLFTDSQPQNEKIIVLLTDGLSNVNHNKTMIQSNTNKEKNIIQCAIGITQFADEEELINISTSKAHYLSVANFNHLSSLINRILPILKCPTPPLITMCHEKADIAFILDKSGSIENINTSLSPDRDYYWKIMKKFIVNVTKKFDTANDRARFSLVTFNHEVNVIFRLNDFLNSSQIQVELDNLKSPESTTDMYGGLVKMNDELFNETNGDRPNVTNIGILITDGQQVPNDQFHNTQRPAQEAKNRSTILFAIGLTNEINRTELNGICSQPAKEHFFERTTIPNIDSIFNLLVQRTCVSTCQHNTANSCIAKCDGDLIPRWTLFENRILVGHDNAKIPDVKNLQDCQDMCMQTSFCRSIEYLSQYNECYLSFFVEKDFPADFMFDTYGNYYEWNCPNKP